MSLWAFGISRTGLALSERRFWSLTPREYHALRREWEKDREREQWSVASIQAAIYNCNVDTDGVPFIAADFMGHGDREQRRAKRLAEKIESDREVLRVNTAKLEPDKLPVWARSGNG